MLTTLEQIHRKLPQASETILQEVLTILIAAIPQKYPQSTPDDFNLEDSDLADEFAQWEAASDEDSAQIEEMLTKEQI
jgi:hypothetical protein